MQKKKRFLPFRKVHKLPKGLKIARLLPKAIFLRRKRSLSRIRSKEGLIEAIKDRLQYPKLTLELLSELKAGLPDIT